jgi:DamX protein
MQDDVPNVFLMPIQAEATDTLAQIQQKLSIHLKDQGDANHLDDNLKNLQVFDQTPVLMIDDAHVLSDTTLQEIIRYRQQLLSDKELGIKILLFANRGMASTIEQISDLQHSQLFVQEMPALSSKQIPSFIGHRLAMAGAQQPPLLDDRLVQAIYKKSAGRPLQVMQQATAVLEKLGRQRKASFKLALPGKSGRLFGALTVLAGIAIAGYFLLLAPQQVDPLSLQPSSSGPPPLAPQIKIPIQQPPAGPETAMDMPGSTDPQAGTEGQEQATSELPVELPTPGTRPLPAPADTDPVEHPASKPPAPVVDEPVAVEEPVAAPPAEAKRDTMNPPPAQPAPPPAVESTPAKIPAAAPPAGTRPPLDPALQTLEQLGIKDRNWLLQQDSRHWTLQVLGAREPVTLARFAKQYQLGENTAWYTTDLKGEPWYVLVHRVYTDKDVARQSIQRLPAGMQQSRPWVKSVASVQQAIRQH